MESPGSCTKINSSSLCSSDESTEEDNSTNGDELACSESSPSRPVPKHPPDADKEMFERVPEQNWKRCVHSDCAYFDGYRGLGLINLKSHKNPKMNIYSCEICTDTYVRQSCLDHNYAHNGHLPWLSLYLD